MAEPVAPVESLVPDAARVELEATRGHEGLYDPAHPEHGTLTQRMNALTARVRGGAAPAPLAPSTESPSPPAPAAPPSAEEIAARLAALSDDPHEPQTAAEALAIPRDFSEPQRAQGWRRDDAQRAEGYAAAEREGLIPAALQFEGLIYELAGHPMPTGEETEDHLFRERGARFDHEAERATEVWTLLERRLPALAANLTRTGLRYHPRTFDILLAMHMALYDATTPAGVARLKAKYTAPMEAPDGR